MQIAGCCSWIPNLQDKKALILKGETKKTLTSSTTDTAGCSTQGDGTDTGSATAAADDDDDNVCTGPIANEEFERDIIRWVDGWMCEWVGEWGGE